MTDGEAGQAAGVGRVSPSPGQTEEERVLRTETWGAEGLRSRVLAKAAKLPVSSEDKTGK